MPWRKDFRFLAGSDWSAFARLECYLFAWLVAIYGGLLRFSRDPESDDRHEAIGKEQSNTEAAR
jgi:hypothetical protein